MNVFRSIVLSIFVLCAAHQGYAAEPITLLPPAVIGGKPLMMALNERKSSRSFSARELPLEVLSNLLWAAGGVNRPDGKRTAPTAGDSREIDIYVALKSGAYRYDANQHILEPVLDEDIRALTGKQSFTQQAPVNLVFVSDLKRLPYKGFEEFYSATDTGYISQNVYLFCASEGLATVILGWVDKDALAAKMGLSNNQRIILTQPVGYPAQ